MEEHNEHGYCPACLVDLDGGSIWQTGYKYALAGKHYEQTGPATPDEAEKRADAYAACYGATRMRGKWGRAIGISDGDSAYAWECPDCGHIWDHIMERQYDS